MKKFSSKIGFEYKKKIPRSDQIEGSFLFQNLERAMGIEPTSQAWEARILPMNYARKSRQILSLQKFFANSF